MSQFRYSCTGQVKADGFPAFLARELGGPRANIQAFAKELCLQFAAPNVTLVNSGSSANLASALAACQEHGRGEALVAGFTFPTTMSALQLAGFDLRVIDTEPNGFCMDPASLKAAINSRTKVVCFTHFLGFPAQVEELCAIASKHGLLVIQDACETMDLRIAGRPAHSFGDYTTWSFYHPHHLSSYGGGGVISNRPDRHRLVESVSHWGRECICHLDPASCTAPHGMNHNFWYVRIGQNLEMSELNACFGRFQLQTWQKQEKRRKKNYAVLYDALSDVPGIYVYKAPAGSGSPFVFPITVEGAEIEALAARLQERGVETRTLMGGVITRQPAFAGVAKDDLRCCRRISASSLFVGVHQTLPNKDVSAVASILRKELA